MHLIVARNHRGKSSNLQVAVKYLRDWDLMLAIDLHNLDVKSGELEYKYLTHSGDLVSSIILQLFL